MIERVAERLTTYTGDCLSILPTLPAESVDCVVTSPPYWQLRDYGASGQLGLEATPDEHVAKMVKVFGEVKRVLKKTGTCWVNYGDSYSTEKKWGKTKDLCLIPQRFAIAHELAHFLLHRSEIDRLGEIADNVLYRSGASETIEYEANRLAAQIIMPEEAISERQQAIGNNIDENIVDQLAKEFGVSKAVMKIRIAAAETAE